jgi:hypothetical protein
LSLIILARNGNNYCEASGMVKACRRRCWHRERR